MIFIILGSQKFPFNRLLKKVDQLVRDGVIQEKIFAQIGYSDYKPERYEYQTFMNRDDFSEKIKEADIIITHGGTGTIVEASVQGKKIIAVPRLKKYGEHVDDHQIELIKIFEEMNIICACWDCEKLDEAYHIVHNNQYKRYSSQRDIVINDIKNYIDLIE